MVGTPAYGGMVHIDYLQRLFEYTRREFGSSSTRSATKA